jgi:D-alanyl-D-alanine dipeptidase
MKRELWVNVCILVSFVIVLTQAYAGWVDASESTYPAGFIDIMDVAPSVILDIRYCTPHNFVGERIDGYQAPKCILTRETAEALKKVQHELSKFSLSLKVYDCYRPQRAVDHFVRWAKEMSDTRMKIEFYLTVKKKDLLRDGYISYKSSHSRGSAVDVTLVSIPVPKQEDYVPGQKLCECYLPAEERFKDNGIDMGTGFDCFHEFAHTANNWVGPQQRANRQLLKIIMENCGFRNYEKEWWHFTLKDEPFPHTYFNFVIE